MAGSLSRANQRQHGKRKGYYTSQKDKTPINKIITQARHAVRYSDRAAKSRLAQKPKIDLSRAARKAESPRIKKFLGELQQ